MQELSKDQQALEGLLTAGLNGLLNKQVDSWVEMFTDDGSMEFPYAFDGYQERVESRESIAGYMSAFPDRLELNKIEGPVFHHSLDPAKTIVEFSCQGKALGTGLPYNQRYIGVVTMRDGKVLNYKDYWNPLIAIQAMGGEEALREFGKEGES